MTRKHTENETVLCTYSSVQDKNLMKTLCSEKRRETSSQKEADAPIKQWVRETGENPFVEYFLFEINPVA